MTAASVRVAAPAEGGRPPRPSGLTGLAILNFLYGSSAILSALTAPTLHETGLDTPGFVATKMLVGSILGALLFVSGLGYLQQRRRLGRGLGLLYAIAGVAGNLALARVSPFGFDLGAILGLFYPAFTLFLLLAVFRHDFA